MVKKKLKVKKMSGFKKFVFIAAIILISITSTFIYVNNHLCYQARDKIEDPEKKIVILERANKFYPFSDLVLYELGKAYFELGIQNLKDGELSRGYLRKSIENFIRSLKINPASYFGHFNLAQSLLYMSYLSSDNDIDYCDEYKKAALLAGHNSQIYFEVSKIFLSRWPSLSEEDKNFTLEILNRIFQRKNPEEIQPILQIWGMNIEDYEFMEKLLPEDTEIYRMYAKFLGEKSLSREQRQKFLAKAELLDYEKAKGEYQSGENEFQYYRLTEASDHFKRSLDILEKINFYEDLSGQRQIDIEEFNGLRKSACLNLAKCRLESGHELKEVEGYLLTYLELEERVASVDELENYLRDRGVIEEKLDANLNDLHLLSFQSQLYFRQNRYRDIIRMGRLLEKSFVVVPEESKKEYVRILQIVGDSFQKVDYIYDAGEFYEKALEVDPNNLETLLRRRQNYERLNDEGKVWLMGQRIENVRSPKGIVLRNSLINKGERYSRNLILDGRAIVLDLRFRNIRRGDIAPLISVFFNGRIVWEDYLEGNTISVSLNSEIGQNNLVVVPDNRSVSLLRIDYRLER
jgi:hypothetical protein